MISQTEAYVIIGMAFYTLLIVFGIHCYEAKIKNLNSEIETHVQSHQNSVDIINELDIYNKILQDQIKELKAQLAGEAKDFQYESSAYKSNTYTSKKYEILTEL